LYAQMRVERPLPVSETWSMTSTTKIGSRDVGVGFSI